MVAAMRETSRPPVESISLAKAIEAVVGQPVRVIEPLAGGMIGQVWKVTLTDGSRLVAKDAAGQDANLDLEGQMIRCLHDAAIAPIPRVVHASPRLLLQEFMPGDHLTPFAHADAGEVVARLHAVRGPAFGFAGPTLNGSFVLPNGWHERWIPFFRDLRLGHSADAAMANGRLRPSIRERIERLRERLENVLTEPAWPALLHGDLWSANVLARGARVTALIDPSTLYGHPELELAYAIGMGGLGDDFVCAYARHHRVDERFWSVRRHVYLTYPAIMHVYYFGGRYEGLLDECLTASGV
jgi:fructosamine-3-kinase